MFEAEKGVDGWRDGCEFGVVAGECAVTGGVVAFEVVAGKALDDIDLVFEWFERGEHLRQGVVGEGEVGEFVAFGRVLGILLGEVGGDEIVVVDAAGLDDEDEAFGEGGGVPSGMEGDGVEEWGEDGGGGAAGEGVAEEIATG